jgi:hypothetical protein
MRTKSRAVVVPVIGFKLVRVLLAVIGYVAVASGLARASIFGFGGTGVGWTVNYGPGGGDAPTIAGDFLTLTNNSLFDHNSAFFNTPQPVGQFIAAFTYQAGGSLTADGVAFVLQNAPAGASAVGARGGSLGYASISPSAAVEFNLWDGGSNGTGYYTMGNTGHVGGLPYLSTSPVSLKSGDPIEVTLTYDGTTLTETLVDSVTSDTFTQTYTVDIPSDVSDTTAFVGFTGATGDYTSVQTVSDFQFVTSTAGALLCSAGANDGQPCMTDSDCPGGACVIAGGVCAVSAPADQIVCDCPASTCVCPDGVTSCSSGTCSGGPFVGYSCDPTANCEPGAACVGTQKVCSGGTDTSSSPPVSLDGASCLNDVQCGGGTCVSTGRFCAGMCQSGSQQGAICVVDSECTGCTPTASNPCCTSDFEDFSCVSDDDCCQNPPCPVGLCTTPLPSCVGDCNGDGTVTVDEILTMVSIALGNADVSTCSAGDANRDGRITVDEILTAVNNALNGCPGH